MYYVVALIVEGQGGTCSNRPLLSVICLMSKPAYVLPYSDLILALLLVGFTEYDDD
ncbi:hypothetical protein Hanom_Chr13g01228781 [Helianthus anomalus]